MATTIEQQGRQIQIVDDNGPIAKSIGFAGAAFCAFLIIRHIYYLILLTKEFGGFSFGSLFQIAFYLIFFIVGATIAFLRTKTIIDANQIVVIKGPRPWAFFTNEEQRVNVADLSRIDVHQRKTKKSRYFEIVIKTKSNADLRVATNSQESKAQEIATKIKTALFETLGISLG